jgi:transcriptional regulator with XRE-family HTH domain
MVLTFGERVALLRRRRGFTQADLAAKIGVRGNTISRIERSTHGKWGFEDVKGKTVVALARHLRVSADYLLGLSEDDHEITWSPAPAAEEQATPSPAVPEAGATPTSQQRKANARAQE